jgi:hypothetical protein
VLTHVRGRRCGYLVVACVTTEAFHGRNAMFRGARGAPGGPDVKGGSAPRRGWGVLAVLYPGAFGVAAREGGCALR